MPTYGVPPPDSNDPEDTPAVDMIRQKIESLYGEGREPNAEAEAEIAENISKNASKHQKFMHKLISSGKSLAEIQTAWHHYYLGLPDHEKHEVWQEFYKAYGGTHFVQKTAEKPAPETNEPAQPKSAPIHSVRDHLANQAHSRAKRHSYSRTRPASTAGQQLSKAKSTLASKVSAGGKLKARHHAKSLLFGLGIGSFVVIILLFGFFNERIIAPFISPSKQVSSTPIIVDPASATLSSEPKVIIPKINVEIPVVYGQTSVAEGDVQKSLEEGVLHYPTTVKPGEHGNAAFFGHSSNNIFNKGKYKFAFVLLNRLEPGDVFYLNYNGKQYAYRVYDKRIVSPDQFWVLNTRDKADTATLITCDPPGTTINRLVVTGEQISPNPNNNQKSAQADVQQSQARQLPGNAPSLWSRLWDWLSN
jgi:LPXTG-site transpeptidase (sortase) family protein